MVTYEWTISKLNCNITEGDLSNVVKAVHWRYKGTDDNGTTSELYGVQSVPSPNPDSFTEYDQLDLAIVSQWLESEMDLTNMKLNISNKINEINNPTTVDLPLPS